MQPETGTQGTLAELAASSTALAAGAAALLLFALVWWRLFARTGHPGAYGLLMLVPGVNVVMLLVLAFRRWPIERELARLRKLDKAVHAADGGRLRRAA